MKQFLSVLVLFSGVSLYAMCAAATIRVPQDQPDIRSAVDALIASGTSIEAIAAPCRTPYGLAWDGQNLWCSDFETRRIYKMTPDGEVLDDFPSPAVYPTGMTWDGQHLWLADAHGAIIRMDESCRPDRILPSPGPNPEGITWDGQCFFVADSVSQSLSLIDAEGEIVAQTDYPTVDFEIDVAGLAFQNNRLWIVDRYASFLYVYDPIEDRFAGGVLLPGKDCRGVAHDGTDVWLSDISDGKIYRVGIDFSPGEIVLADGVYQGPRNRGLTVDGRAIRIRSENGPASCIVDCMEKDRLILIRYMEERTSEIEGISIRNGNSVDLERTGGGAIRLFGASAVIRNCRFFNCRADYGTVFYKYSSGEVDSCQFDRSGNVGLGTDFANRKTVIVRESRFTKSSGSGIYVPEAARVLIDRCIFEENSVSIGGAVDLRNTADLKITASVFKSNSATTGGAVYLENNTCAMIQDCVFLMNIAYSGAAVACGTGGLNHFCNCLFTRNRASKSGAAISNRSIVSLNACSIVDNIAYWEGGGVSCSTNSALNTTSSVVFGNYPDQIAGDALYAVEYSNVQDGFDGEHNIDADPQFEFGVLGDYCLSSASPCIDAGHGMAHDICIPVADGTVCLDRLTTRQDSVPDSGILDMGYHYTPYRNDPDFRIRIDLPHHFFAPGDPCEVAVDIFNPSGQTVPGTPVFVWLEMGGVLYCAPSFGTFDYYSIDLVPGETRLQVLDPFIWPEGISSVIGVHWYAALTDPGMTRIVGWMDLFPMAW